jgi:dihydrofolate reductase
VAPSAAGLRRDGGGGEWRGQRQHSGADPWRGFWGENRPYHHPVFVLTHHAREPLEMEGGTTFHFVTGGIDSALEQAQEATAGKDVSLGGGATAVQQYLAAGLLDEILISFVPVLLGDGARPRSADAPANDRRDRDAPAGRGLSPER